MKYQNADLLRMMSICLTIFFLRLIVLQLHTLKLTRLLQNGFQEQLQRIICTPEGIVVDSHNNQDMEVNK